MQIPCADRCFIIAEIGINHNGDLRKAKSLIDLAVNAGCDAVKFQKRTVEVVYTEEDLARPRESPFGTTNGDLKRGLEFGVEQYSEIEAYCRKKRIAWGASSWDEGALDFMEQFDVAFHKVASASLTDYNLLRKFAAINLPLIISTGGSTMDQIAGAVATVQGHENVTLMHSCSAYPANYQDLNLRAMYLLRHEFGLPVGYSGHETGIAPSVAAVAMGACVVERHITPDRSAWGSDQAASLGPRGVYQLVRDIRLVEESMGDGHKRVMPAEIPVMQKLRRVP